MAKSKTALVLNMETMWTIGVSSTRFGNTYTGHRA